MVVQVCVTSKRRCRGQKPVCGNGWAQYLVEHNGTFLYHPLMSQGRDNIRKRGLTHVGVGVIYDPCRVGNTVTLVNWSIELHSANVLFLGDSSIAKSKTSHLLVFTRCSVFLEFFFSVRSWIQPLSKAGAVSSQSRSVAFLLRYFLPCFRSAYPSQDKSAGKQQLNATYATSRFRFLALWYSSPVRAVCEPATSNACVRRRRICAQSTTKKAWLRDLNMHELLPCRFGAPPRVSDEHMPVDGLSCPLVTDSRQDPPRHLKFSSIIL